MRSSNDGLPGPALRVVADYMAAHERLRSAARAVMEAADDAVQVRLGASDGELLAAVVPWPVLDKLREAIAR